MRKNNKSSTDTKRISRIKAMISELKEIEKKAFELEKDHEKQLQKVHPSNLKGAKNLIYYRTLRQYDISDLQKKLTNLGLSRMEKPQASVLASLKMTKSILRTFLGKQPKTRKSGLTFKKSSQIIKRNAKNLLGYRSKGRHARIMVTLPSEAAQNYKLVEKMVASGMNCARINCAHDSAEEWLKMIQNIRKAAKKLNNHVKVAMDLAGPKIRTGALIPGPKVKKFRPAKDLKGRIREPLLFRIGVLHDPGDPLPFLPIDQNDLKQLDAGDTLYFRDARGKKRKLKIEEKKADSCLATINKTCYFETGLKIFFQKNIEDDFITVGELPPVEIPIVLQEGDYLRIDREKTIGEPAKFETDSSCSVLAHVSCTEPRIFEEVKVGEPILFDDGRITGEITKVKKDYLLVKVVRALDTKTKLRSDKGINLPVSKLTISGLTKKDKVDMKFVVEHADILNMSFVNSQKDVKELLATLKNLNAKPELGLILKIETQNGFDELTDILLEAMQWENLGVMIARGDLAIEVGWNNIGRVQQEILTLCEAAHVTNIWATQVLENLAKRGVPSRSEITDVIKAQQADCVMLNKGPYIMDAIKFLDRVLKDMEPYREKSARLTPPMAKASN